MINIQSKSVELTAVVFSTKSQISLSDEERERLEQSLTEMLQSSCDSAHEQCGRLLSSRTKDGALLERVSSQEFVALAQMIEHFVADCENISKHKSLALRLAFQVFLSPAISYWPVFKMAIGIGSNRARRRVSCRNSMRKDVRNWAPFWTANAGERPKLQRTFNRPSIHFWRRAVHQTKLPPMPPLTPLSTPPTSGTPS